MPAKILRKASNEPAPLPRHFTCRSLGHRFHRGYSCRPHQGPEEKRETGEEEEQEGFRFARWGKGGRGGRLIKTMRMTSIELHMISIGTRNMFSFFGRRSSG